jgi:hypothetical protein
LATEQRFVFLTDLHYGYERKNRHKVPLHDVAAMDLALQFTNDFQPDVLILGGDILDCGCISHHNRHKPGRTEGMRLLDDATECRTQFIQQLPEAKTSVYITGNHEAWLSDAVDDFPALEGMFDVRPLLQLGNNWRIVPQGEAYTLGKLAFIHGDTVSGGEHCAKSAVITYGQSVRFGHFHTAQQYTKNTPINHKLAHTGMAVGCLCRKDPKYGKNKPNRWVQGLNYGISFPDGTYADQQSLIINGRMWANGKLYKA